MKISVIVCHHKGDLVLDAIKTLKQSKRVEVDLIVATSTDRSFIGTRTLFIQGGPARKRNIAFRFAESDFVAFFDDDVKVDPYALWEMVKAFEEGTGMVFGKLLNMQFPKMFDEAGSFMTPTGFLWSRGDRQEDRGQFEEIEPILAGKSAACMIRRKAFAQAGFFDESYEILGEETDLAWRVWQRGWNVLFAPKSVTYHAFNTRFKPLDFYTHQRVYYNGCRNYLTMLTTNLPFGKLLLALPCQLGAWSLSALGMALSGKGRASFYIVKGLWYYFSHLPEILRKRFNNLKGVNHAFLKYVTKAPSVMYYLARLFRYLRTGLHG